MSDDLFNLCDDEEDLIIKKNLDPNTLNDDARTIYDTYLSITDLKELPESDYVFLVQTSRNYYTSPLCVALRDTIASYDSFKKAKKEGRIKDFQYILNFLNILNGTRIKKVNYEQQFNNVDKFLSDNSSNESFIVLKSYIDNGKIPIISSEDTKDMYNVFDVYSPEEISIAIKDCKDNSNTLVYNLKFLLYVLKKNKSNQDRMEDIWVAEFKAMKSNVECVFAEKNYIEEESEKDKEYYKIMNKKIEEEIRNFKG